MKDNIYQKFFKEMKKEGKLLDKVIKLDASDKKYINFVRDYYRKYNRLQKFWNQNIPSNPLHILSKIKKCSSCKIIFYAPIKDAKPIKKGSLYYCEECAKRKVISKS